MVDLQMMLKELYEEFYKILMSPSEATPSIVFILQFLEHLSLKAPTLTLLSSLPHQVVRAIEYQSLCWHLAFYDETGIFSNDIFVPFVINRLQD